MNGYYECEDPLAITRVKQQNCDVYPYRSRTLLQPEYPAKPPASASTVWNVVSSLVQALSYARDELLTLLTSDDVRVARKSDGAARARRSSSSPTSRSPSRSPCRSPCRSPLRPLRPLSAPSDSRRSRSPLRASGDRGMIRSSMSSGTQKSRTTASYNTPPVSFGMNLQFDSVRRGLSPPAGCRRPAGRYQPMTMNQREMITPHGLECVPVPGERRRHCAATRFAELIEAETSRLRERRLAEESAATALRSRPSWY